MERCQVNICELFEMYNSDAISTSQRIKNILFGKNIYETKLLK